MITSYNQVTLYFSGIFWLCLVAPVSVSSAELKDVHAAAFFLKLNPVSAALNPRPYWLFKDGVICNCAKIPLSELNLEKISKEEPKLLGQWRKNSKKYEVKWLSDTKFKKKIGGAIARPLPKGWRLSGYYEGASGKTGLPGFHAGTWEGYYFTMDGTVAAGHGGATSPTTPGYRPKTSKRQGKYEIENYTLTMHFDDGAVQTTFLSIVFTKIVISAMNQKTQAFG